jgi:hypothetical protein
MVGLEFVSRAWKCVTDAKIVVFEIGAESIPCHAVGYSLAIPWP